MEPHFPHTGSHMSARAAAGFALLFALTAGASDSVTLFQAVEGSKEHTVLALAAIESKERAALGGTAEYTLFAPTDAAFKALPPATVKALATDKAALARLVRGHLVAGKVSVADLRKLNGGDLKTLAGTALKVEATADAITVGGAKLVSFETRCSNGILYVTSAVLPLPKE
jgi:uncharacterized surface protein with fasciclin (FAS1) repeats